MSNYVLSVVTVCPKSEGKSLAIAAIMYKGGLEIARFAGKYVTDSGAQDRDEMTECFFDATGGIVASAYRYRYDLITHFFRWKAEFADGEKRVLDASQNKTGNGQMVRYGGISELYEEAHHLGIPVRYDFYTVDLADEQLLKGELPHYFCGRHGIGLNPQDYKGGAYDPSLVAEEMILAYRECVR